MPSHASTGRSVRYNVRHTVLAEQSWSWQTQAACRTAPRDLFFGPEGERPVERDDRETRALEICDGCPVREACRRHAIRVPEPYGVWGGTTEGARAAARRARLASSAA